ncbi:MULTISPECIES: DUF6153 family protein [Micromonospora]|uniref:DUF6153 family protein n=1 Tax=Micromonospora TaxID=1873 RepID=UPI0004C1FEC3|nr:MULTISPECIES: DUF6153 family protein [Micromonospora]
MRHVRVGRPPARAPLRLALLVAVTLGVFGMHTLGHPGEPGAAHASTAHRSAAAPAAEHGPDGSPGHRGGEHAFTVCLAVLGGALILGVLSLLRSRHRGARTPTGHRRRVISPDRGPPRRPIGLRLRAVTVLRT